MNDAADYLAQVRSFILINSRILDWQLLCEEVQGNLGLIRYRLTLDNHELLELFERFEIQQNQVIVTKYSFHWQRDDGQLIKRGANATHHLHDGHETRILPSEPMNIVNILSIVSMTT